MKETSQQALLNTLEYLITLVRERTSPEEAKARMRLLQMRHRDTEMDLLWEQESYDQSVHYDVLLHLAGDGTVSLSFCPEQSLPWSLRGVHRWSEADLVRVNNIVLKIDQAIASLDFMWDDARVIDRLVNACLIQEALEKEPIEVSDVELQRTMDAFRRRHKLYTADETYRWMERHGMTHEKLEHLVADEATVAKIRDRVAGDRVEVYFEAHRSDFDTAWIARFVCTDENSADRTREQIRSGRVDFYEAAQRCFLTAERSEYSSPEFFVVVQRWQAPPELEVVFAAAPGEMLGPVHTKEGYAIVRVLSLTPARLDDRTRATIKKIIFEEWLAERRRAAKVEWFWGNTSQTSQAT